MTERDKQSPGLSAKGEAAKTDRAARLGEALRANLRKRKAQARGRSEAEAGAAGPGDTPRDPEAR